MAIDTNIRNYATSHDKGGSGGGTTLITGTVKNSNIPADLRVTSITASNGNINRLQGTSESFNDAEFVYLTTKEGQILKIKGTELNYTLGNIDELKSGKITTDNIKSNDATITTAVIDALSSTNITTEYLTVTKQAHFFELVIDKVKSVGGSLIITGANSIIAYVKAFDSNNVEVPMFDANGDPIAESTINNAAAYFKVYWLGKDDNTGRENEDEWYVGDQAYCQSFNVHQGTNFNASNKYYWRKVIAHESPVYMNTKTGEELQSGQSELYNEVYIDTPALSYTVSGTTYTVNKGWNVAVQSLSEVTWTADSSVVDGTTCGTMGTKGTTFGIQLSPNTSTGSIQDIIPETFSFTCDKARLGVGFVYQDGTYEWFAAPEQGLTSYTFSLTTSTPIDTVIITNADDVEWKLVRGIRLSNTIKDSNLVGAASIPSIGDNITQLGHRYDEADSELGQNTQAAKERASAIIIAAYHTPDKGYGTEGQSGYVRGLTPPSYAQYKLIKTFELSKYRHTFFDAKGSAFYGDFYAGSGNNIADYNELAAGTPELFVAYAVDDGQGSADPNNWTKTPASDTTYEFIGYATETVPPGSTRAAIEQTLQFSDYDWSKMPGSYGKDGDGVEYIYATAIDEQTSNRPPIIRSVMDSKLSGLVNGLLQAGPNYSISAWKPYQSAAWRYVTDNDYIPPSKKVYHEAGGNYTVAGYYPDTDWSDDPQSLDSTNNKVEYISQRKYDGTTQTWEPFSTPEIWAMYGGTGPAGPQGDAGPQGAAGINGIIYKLVDMNSNASYGITLDSNNNGVVNCTALFQYRIARISNNNVYYLTALDRDSYKPTGTFYLLYPYVKVNNTTLSTPHTYWYRLKSVGSDSTHQSCKYEIDLSNASAAQKQVFIDSNPTFEIALIPIPRDSYPAQPDYLDPSNSTEAGYINNALDRQEIKMTMTSAAQFQVVQGANASIKALVTGQQGLSELIIGPQGIQTQVTDLGNEISGVQSQVSQLPNQILSQVTKTYNEAQGLGVATTIDLTSNTYNSTSWYPVTIALPNRLFDSNGTVISGSEGFEHRIQIRRYLNSNYGVPAYADDTDGFVVCLDFTTVAHGDTVNNIETWQYDTSLNRNGEPLVINKYEVDYTKTQSSQVSLDNIDPKAICSVPVQNHYGSWKKVISMYQQQNHNDEIVYLRGGSKYDIYTSDIEIDQNTGLQEGPIVNVWNNGYTKSSGTPTFSYPVITNWHDLNIAEQDMMPRSEIKQTVDSIELNVYDTIYEKTGIDIEAGTITLNADNTSINGSLKIYGAKDGVVIFNDNGGKAVEIVKESLGTFGQNQNTNNHLSSSTATYTYIIGNNGSFRMYLSNFNTSAENNDGGYTNDNRYYGDTMHLPAIMDLGVHYSGEVLKFRNVEWTMSGTYSNTLSQYYVKPYLYYLNSDHIVSWRNAWVNPTSYSNGKFTLSLNSNNYTIPQTGSGQRWYLGFDFKGPNSSNDQKFTFNITADLLSSISINTKIGTDGFRTITPQSETWISQEKITNLFYGSGTNMYGTNYKLFGTSVDQYGTNNVFGSASVDIANGTPISNPSFISVGSVAPLLNVTSNVTADNDTNRINGTIGWEYNSAYGWCSIKVFNSSVHIIPKYIVINSRRSSYENLNHIVFLNNASSSYLPVGTEIHIFNNCTSGNILICGYGASSVSNISYSIIDWNDSSQTATYQYYYIENGESVKLVHFGNGLWKPMQLNGSINDYRGTGAQHGNF